jgi:hypothetical protein
MQRSPIINPLFQGLFKVLQDPGFWILFYFILFYFIFIYFFGFFFPPSLDLRWLGSSKLVSCGPECVTWLVSNRWIAGPNGGRRSPSSSSSSSFLPSFLPWSCSSRIRGNLRIAHLLIGSGNNYRCKAVKK